MPTPQTTPGTGRTFRCSELTSGSTVQFGTTAGSQLNGKFPMEFDKLVAAVNRMASRIHPNAALPKSITPDTFPAAMEMLLMFVAPDDKPPEADAVQVIPDAVNADGSVTMGLNQRPRNRAVYRRPVEDIAAARKALGIKPKS